MKHDNHKQIPYTQTLVPEQSDSQSPVYKTDQPKSDH